MRRLLPLLGIGAFSILLFGLATSAHAQSFVNEINYTLEQPFGNRSVVTSFGEYLQLVYSYAAGLIGIIAVVLIMAGGIMWIAAGGNEQIIGTAKEIIVSALTAVLIIVLSYAILIVINPRLVEISFSLQRIPLGETDDIYNLPKCTDAPFTGNTCISESGGEVLCAEIPCGEIGYLNGPGTCRGGAFSCSAGYGCYRDAGSPEDTMSCQLMACGQRVDACANANDIDGIDYESCICQHYVSMMGYFGVSSGGILPLYTTADQPAVYAELCNESTSNADWATKVTTAPYSTLYTGSPSQASSIGLNCGFSSICSLTNAMTPSGCYSYCGPQSDTGYGC